LFQARLSCAQSGLAASHLLSNSDISNTSFEFERLGELIFRAYKAFQDTMKSRVPVRAVSRKFLPVLAVELVSLL